MKEIKHRFTISPFSRNVFDVLIVSLESLMFFCVIKDYSVFINMRDMFLKRGSLHNQ